jgi:hypothetical protein
MHSCSHAGGIGLATAVDQILQIDFELLNLRYHISFACRHLAVGVDKIFVFFAYEAVLVLGVTAHTYTYQRLKINLVRHKVSYSCEKEKGGGGKSTTRKEGAKVKRSAVIAEKEEGGRERIPRAENAKLMSEGAGRGGGSRTNRAPTSVAMKTAAMSVPKEYACPSIEPDSSRA